jgi:hypothetical protein
MNMCVDSSMFIPLIGGVYLLGVYLILRVFQLKNSDKVV